MKKIELNDREFIVVRCCIGIEIKNFEMEQIQLESRIDRLSRLGIECESKKDRLEFVLEMIQELGELAKKFE